MHLVSNRACSEDLAAAREEHKASDHCSLKASDVSAVDGRSDSPHWCTSTGKEFLKGAVVVCVEEVPVLLEVDGVCDCVDVVLPSVSV